MGVMGIVDTITTLISVLESSHLDTENLMHARSLAHKALFECLNYTPTATVVPCVSDVTQKLDMLDLQTSASCAMCIQLESEIMILRAAIDELKADNNELKAANKTLEADNKKIKTFIREKEERGIIRTIAINLEYEIKDEALRMMNTEQRLYFCCKEDPIEQEVLDAKLYKVMSRLDTDQYTKLLQRWFGDQKVDEKYDCFVDALSYMKEGFMEDAHPTKVDGEDVSLSDARRLVTQAKMHGKHRRRRESPHDENFMKETVIHMLDHLEELRSL